MPLLPSTERPERASESQRGLHCSTDYTHYSKVAGLAWATPYDATTPVHTYQLDGAGVDANDHLRMADITRSIRKYAANTQEIYPPRILEYSTIFAEIRVSLCTYPALFVFAAYWRVIRVGPAKSCFGKNMQFVYCTCTHAPPFRRSKNAESASRAHPLLCRCERHRGGGGGLGYPSLHRHTKASVVFKSRRDVNRGSMWCLCRGRGLPPLDLGWDSGFSYSGAGVAAREGWASVAPMPAQVSGRPR